MTLEEERRLRQQFETSTERQAELDRLMTEHQQRALAGQSFRVEKGMADLPSPSLDLERTLRQIDEPDDLPSIIGRLKARLAIQEPISREEGLALRKRLSADVRMLDLDEQKRKIREMKTFADLNAAPLFRSSNAIPAEQPDLGEYLAQREFPGSNLSWMDKRQLKQSFLEAQPQLLARKQMVLQQLEQQKQARNQQESEQVGKVLFSSTLTDSQKEDILKGYMNEGNRYARGAVESIGRKRFGLLPTYQEEFPQEAQEIEQLFSEQKFPEVDARLKILEDMRGKRAASKAKASQVSKVTKSVEASLAAGQDPDPVDFELYLESQAEKDKLKLLLAENREKLSSLQYGKELTQFANIHRYDLDDPTQRLQAESELKKQQQDATIDEMKVNDLIGNERTRDIMTAAGRNPLDVARQAIQGNREAQVFLKAARAQADKELGVLEERKAFGRGIAGLEVPVGTEANKYTKLLPDGTAEAAIPTMGKMEAGKMGYRDTALFSQQLDWADKAKAGLAIMDDLERYARAIITAQGGFQAAWDGAALTLQGITKTGKPTMLPSPSGKALTVGEVASLYQSKMQEVADILSRAKGAQVGTSTEKDTDRSLKGLTSPFETAAMAEEKFRTTRTIFGNAILREFDRAYGRDGVPEILREGLKKGKIYTELSYIEERLREYKKRGLSEEAIRANVFRDLHKAGFSRGTER